MIYTIMDWSKITEYNSECDITITNLIENAYLIMYPWPMEITYDQGSEFIFHEFRKSLFEK